MKYDDILGSFVIKKGMSKNLMKVILQLDWESLIDLQGRLNKQSQQNTSLPKVSEDAIADTGATVCCSGVPMFRKLVLNIR